ncbi:MAG: effector-associated domain EAD1-containing protein [Moraxellaceae bacterium]
MPASSSAGLLVGSVDSASLLGFAREIGADLRRLSDLPLLEHAHMLLSGEDELDNVLAAVRLIEKLSPVPLIGGDVKKAVATRLTAHIATATPRQILALRNLSLTGFPSVPDLWQEVESWFTSRYFALADDPPMMQIVSATTSRDTAVEAWLNVVGRGMTAAARVDSSELPNAVWRWIFKQPDLLDAIFELLPTEQPVELRIASATPEKMPPPLAETIVLKSLARKWSAMHGAVLSAIADPISAAHRQIAIDANEASTTGIKFALRLASSAQLLDCAVQLGDERLISLAVDAVLADPNIFMRSQCTEIAEQKIWEAALRRNGDLWRTPHDPFSARDAALKSLVEGSKVHLPLIEELARTPLADLCDSPLREQFLSDLKIAAGHEYLQATAAGWLKRAMESSPPFSPDLALKTAILSGTDLDKTLSALAPDITAGIRIIEALGGVDEQRFLAWFRALLSQGKALPISGMETLGRLVLARSWHRVVDEMVAKYRGNRFDVKPALRICASMLSLLMRWKLDISAPSVSEKWESFANVAAELYPSGPDHEELWSRAGGSNSDLPRIGSGRSIWLTVISQIRNGRGPSPTRLLREMQQDYRSNPDLSFIANDPDIAGYRR